MKTPTNVDNTVLRQHLVEQHGDVYDYDSFHSLCDSDVEDICYGATKQGNWNKPTSSYRVFMLLSMLDTISTNSIFSALNSRQIALYGKDYSTRTLQRWVQVLVCAHGGLMHHYSLVNK